MYRSSIIALSGMLVATAVAATTTATATSALPTALPALVSQIPSCVAPCWNKVDSQIGCFAGNFDCLCEIDGELVVKMGICIRNSNCPDKEASQAVEIIGSICDVYKQSSGADAVSSASNIITAAAGKATATSSSTPTSTNAANPMGHKIEVVVVAAAAAILL